MRLSRKQPRQHREFGIALISVLWVLLLLSSLAATTVYVSRTNAVLVRRSLQLAQAQAAADAAIVNALSNLSDEQVSRHGPLDGSARSWHFNGVDVTVSVTNEAGRIDVNEGEDDLIYAFLMSQEIAEADSHALLKDLRRWQQASDAPTGSTPGRNGSNAKHPLQTIDELAQIPAWKNQPLGCWTDAFTVYTGSPSINSVYAGQLGLAALQWANEHHLDDKEWLQRTPASAWTNGYQSVSGEILRIQAQAKLTDEVSARADWVGRLTGNSNGPALTMRWSHSLQNREASCQIPKA
jgi:general secretion pathway protein K